MPEIIRTILQFSLQFAAILFAISVHESAHAWTADRLGDPTARLQGRVSLNPIPHIDPIGTLLFPLMLIIINLSTGGFTPIFGWAKPVMVNSYNLRRPRHDHMLISASGPLANLVTAAFIIMVFLLVKNTPLFNVTPLILLLLYTIMINVYLAIFNLLPIHPLDGSGIVEGLLKGEALYNYTRLRPYSLIILMIILFSGLLGAIARPVLGVIFSILGLR